MSKICPTITQLPSFVNKKLDLLSTALPKVMPDGNFGALAEPG
jgi:hypothetical protein